jgi:hypothetical protein
MKEVKKVNELKALELVVYGDENYIVIDVFTTTFFAMNIETKNVELIEGDYLDNGSIDNLFTKGNTELYLLKYNSSDIKKALSLVKNELN